MTSTNSRLTDFNASVGPDRLGSAPPTTISGPERLPLETPDYLIEHPQNRKRLGDLKIKTCSGQEIESKPIIYKGILRADSEAGFEIHRDSSLGHPIGSSTPPPSDEEAVYNNTSTGENWGEVPTAEARLERSVSEASTEVDEDEVRRINAQLLGSAFPGSTSPSPPPESITNENAEPSTTLTPVSHPPPLDPADLQRAASTPPNLTGAQGLASLTTSAPSHAIPPPIGRRVGFPQANRPRPAPDYRSPHSPRVPSRLSESMEADSGEDSEGMMSVDTVQGPRAADGSQPAWSRPTTPLPGVHYEATESLPIFPTPPSTRAPPRPPRRIATGRAPIKRENPQLSKENSAANDIRRRMPEMQWASVSDYPAGDPEYYFGGEDFPQFPKMIIPAKGTEGSITAPKIAKVRLGWSNRAVSYYTLWIKAALFAIGMCSTTDFRVQNFNRNQVGKEWINMLESLAAQSRGFSPEAVEALSDSVWTQRKRFYWHALDTIVFDMIVSIQRTVAEFDKEVSAVEEQAMVIKSEVVDSNDEMMDAGEEEDLADETQDADGSSRKRRRTMA